MTENIRINNTYFKKLSPDHKKLWLNINRNVKRINKMWDIDYDHYLCVHCFEDLGYDMPYGFGHPGGYCAINYMQYFYCDDCVKELNLKIDDGVIDSDIRCPVCWYFQIKDCSDCSKFNSNNKPPIELYQW